MGLKYRLNDHLANILPKGIQQKVHEMIILRETNYLKLEYKELQKNSNFHSESLYL